MFISWIGVLRPTRLFRRHCALYTGAPDMSCNVCWQQDRLCLPYLRSTDGGANGCRGCRHSGSRTCGGGSAGGWRPRMQQAWRSCSAWSASSASSRSPTSGAPWPAAFSKIFKINLSSFFPTNLLYASGAPAAAGACPGVLPARGSSCVIRLACCSRRRCKPLQFDNKSEVPEALSVHQTFSMCIYQTQTD